MPKLLQHPLGIPALLTFCFAVGIAWCIFAMPPMLLGTLLSACPLVITAIAIQRGISTRKANRESTPPKP